MALLNCLYFISSVIVVAGTGLAHGGTCTRPACSSSPSLPSPRVAEASRPPMGPAHLRRVARAAARAAPARVVVTTPRSTIRPDVLHISRIPSWVGVTRLGWSAGIPAWATARRTDVGRRRCLRASRTARPTAAPMVEPARACGERSSSRSRARSGELVSHCARRVLYQPGSPNVVMPSRTLKTVNMPPISMGPNGPLPVIIGNVFLGLAHIHHAAHTVRAKGSAFPSMMEGSSTIVV